MASIRVELRPDHVAILTFDQPGSRANVLTRGLWEEFDAALAGLEQRPDVKGLMLASAKPDVFIAGADLKFFAQVPAPNDPAVRELIELGLRVLDRLENLPFPTCAAIDGAALGGGLEVALACDFRICNPDDRVQLRLPETRLGLIPGWGGTQRLPRIIGLIAAASALTTGMDVRDQMDDDFDLVDTEASGEYLTTCAVGHVLNGKDQAMKRRAIKRDVVSHTLREPFTPLDLVEPVAVREALAVLVRGAELPLADALKLETEAFLRLAGSDESKRLIAEFFAGRKKA